MTKSRDTTIVHLYEWIQVSTVTQYSATDYQMHREVFTANVDGNDGLNDFRMHLLTNTLGGKNYQIVTVAVVVQLNQVYLLFWIYHFYFCLPDSAPPFFSINPAPLNAVNATCQSHNT